VFEELTPPGASEAVIASGTGVFDQRDHRDSVSMQINAEGHFSTAEAQFSRLGLYMRLPSSSRSSSVTHGKPWIRFDLQAAGAALGIDYSSLTSPGASSNPSQMLSYLKAASGHVTRIGSEQVQGLSMTHYRAAIDYGRYAALAPAAKRAAAEQSVGALERLMGTSTQVADVWVDGQHRIRREDLTFHECLPGVAGTTQIHLKLEFLDFGIQVIPQLPPSSEVADVTSYVAEKLKHVKLGCR
jgi:hypothetical protein